MSPRQTQQEYEKKLDNIKLCGANRGMHHYIPIAWVKDGEFEHVKTMMCTVCFTRVEVKLLYELFSEATV